MHSSYDNRKQSFIEPGLVNFIICYYIMCFGVYVYRSVCVYVRLTNIYAIIYLNANANT